MADVYVGVPAGNMLGVATPFMLTVLTLTVLLLPPVPGPALPAQPQSEPRTVARAAAAQDPAPPASQPRTAESQEPPTPEHTGIKAMATGLVGDVKHLPSKPNLYLALIGGGLAAAVHPLDDDLNMRLRGEDSAAIPVFAAGKYIGQTAVQMGAATTVYIVGRVIDEKKVSHLGMDLLRAQILTAGLTTGLKYATQRERPDGSNSHSFPSGHASITFATATVLERHMGWRMSVLGYSIASYVAASRLHDNRHYLSDVVFGAAVGAIGGRTVTEHGRDNWALVPVHVPGGMAILATRTRPF